MKKLFGIILALSVCLGLMSGCGNKAGVEPSPGVSPEESPSAPNLLDEGAERDAQGLVENPFKPSIGGAPETTVNGERIIEGRITILSDTEIKITTPDDKEFTYSISEKIKNQIDKLVIEDDDSVLVHFNKNEGDELYSSASIEKLN